MNIVTPVKYWKMEFKHTWRPGHFIRCPNRLSIQINTNRASPDEEEAIAKTIASRLNGYEKLVKRVQGLVQLLNDLDTADPFAWADVDMEDRKDDVRAEAISLLDELGEGL